MTGACGRFGESRLGVPRYVQWVVERQIVGMCDFKYFVATGVSLLSLRKIPFQRTLLRIARRGEGIPKNHTTSRLVIRVSAEC